MALPRRVDCHQAEYSPFVRFDVDSDRADHSAVREKYQRVIGRIAFIGGIGIILEMVSSTLPMVLLEYAPLPNIVIAGPFTQAPRRSELHTVRAHRATLLLCRKRSQPAPLLSQEYPGNADSYRAEIVCCTRKCAIKSTGGRSIWPSQPFSGTGY